MTRSKAGRRVVPEAARKALSRTDIELEIASLMERLSEIRNSTSSLTETLRLAGCARSYGITIEAEVMLRNALRHLGDAMSYLPAP